MKLVSFTKYNTYADFEFLVNEIIVYVSIKNNEISIDTQSDYIPIDELLEIIKYVSGDEAVITWK